MNRAFSRFAHLVKGAASRIGRTGLPAGADTSLRQPLLTPSDIAEIAVRAAAQTAPRSGILVEQRQTGELRSAHLGSGLEFEEPRCYQTGDDIRSMDWRVMARTGQPYVKVYREEHQPDLHLVVDRGATMRFGTHRRLKVTQAARLAAFFAFSAVGDNTRLSCTLWEPDTRTFSCGAGEHGATLLIDSVIAPCPPLDSASAAKQQVFPALLSHLADSLPRGSHLVLLSDFRQLDAQATLLLARLAAEHRLLAVQILDRAEMRLPDVGLARFEGCTAGAGWWIDTADPDVREGYRSRTHGLHMAQEAALGQAAAFLRVTADEESFETLYGIANYGR